MKALRYVCSLAAALSFSSVICAGQIYGSVTSAGKAVARANIEINCSGAVTKGATAPDGSYRVPVSQQGQCTFTLPDYAGRPSAIIFSAPNPSSYNFDLMRRADGNYDLRRR